MKLEGIMFVDDDELYLRLIRSIVTQKGVEAHYASSGEEALKILRTHHCHSMVTDLNMPGMDGFTLTWHAKRIHPEIRVVMVTGDASREVLRRARAAGIVQVRHKPKSLRAVQEILEDAAPELFRQPNPNDLEPAHASGCAGGKKPDRLSLL